MAGRPPALKWFFPSLPTPLITDADGRFAARFDLETTAVEVTARAEVLVDGRLHVGQSDRAPFVTDGVTDVGVLRLREAADDSGPFARPSWYLGANGVKDFDAVDLDGDGDLDLIACTRGVNGSCGSISGRVCVALLADDGRVTSSQIITTFGASESIAVSDLDGDETPDFVATSTRGLVLGFNDGQGQFFVPGAVDALDYRVVESPDLDGDGLADLAGAHLAGVSLFHNEGGGLFSLRRSLEVGTTTLDLHVGDLNGDERPDVLVASLNERFLVWLGRGDDGFTFDEVPDEYRLGPDSRHTAHSIAMGDFDRDGRNDVALAKPNAFRIAVFPQIDGGRLGDPVELSAGRVRDLHSLDLDVDGDLDLVVSQHGFRTENTLGVPIPGSLDVWTNDGAGVFARQGGIEQRVDPGPVVVRDARGDGTADDLFVLNRGLWSCRFNGDAISLLRRNADGTYTDRESYLEARGMHQVILADIDQDDDLDAVLATTGTLLGINAGGGRFDSLRGLPITSGFDTRVAVGDFNGDGRLDVVGSTDFALEIAVHLNEGGGQFAPVTRYEPSGAALGILAVDFDGDERPDLAVASQEGIETFANLGDGAFTKGPTALTGRRIAALAAGDVDGDGDRDLIASGSIDGGGTTLAVLLNDGGGALVVGQRLRDFGFYATHIATADLDGDGDTDLAVSTERGGTVSVYLGAGDGTFSRSSLLSLREPRGIAIGDFDLDGAFDLAVADAERDHVVLFLGDGEGAFPRRLSYDAGQQPYWLDAADLDSDGDLDIVVANRGNHFNSRQHAGSDLAVLRNRVRD